MAQATSKVVKQLTKRIKSVHRWARTVGVLYIIASIGLLLLSCLSVVRVNGADVLGVRGLFASFTSADWVMTACLIGYIVMMVVALINFIALLKHSKGVFASSWSGAKGENVINRNAESMEVMGKIYSRLLSTLMAFNFVFLWVLSVGGNPASLNYIGIIMIAAGLLFHFLCGLFSAKVTRFERTYRQAPPLIEEVKRDQNIWIFVYRNFFQLLILIALMCLFCRFAYMGEALVQILNLKDKSILNNTNLLVELIVELCIGILLICLICRSFSIVEFNFEGMEGRGMKNYRVFTIITFIFAIIYVVWQLAVMQPASLPLNSIAFTLITVVGVLLDTIIAPRSKDLMAKWTKLRFTRYDIMSSPNNATRDVEALEE